MTVENPQQKQLEQSNQPFEWPVSASPHAQDLALASKLCATTFPANFKSSSFTTTHLSTGRSSNDVVKVSFPSTTAHPSCHPFSRNFIVKLPRIQPSQSFIISSHSNCKSEALRTSWAAKHGFGPNVLAIDEENGAFAMEYVVGRTLTMVTTLKHLPSVVVLLREIHSAKAEDWMRRYDPLVVVKKYLECLKTEGEKNFSIEDELLVESVLRKYESEIKGGGEYPLVPCHNDFHSHNVMLRHATTSGKKLLAIDFEDCDLGDPMWDLAYLTVNLEFERTPLALAELYGASVDERRRLRAYVPLAMAHCATWAGVQAGSWDRHQAELMQRLRHVVARHR